MTISHQIKNVGNSLETAYIAQDYPYGFTLRCEKAYWVETKGNKGQRLVTCTKNPKTGLWNKPKAGVYYQCIVLYEDLLGHVQVAPLSNYSGIEGLKEYVTKWELTEEQAKSIDLKAKGLAVLDEYFKQNPIKFGVAT